MLMKMLELHRGDIKVIKKTLFDKTKLFLDNFNMNVWVL